MQRRLLEVRDLFAVRAHFGWGYYLLQRVGRLPAFPRPLLASLNRRFEAYTSARSIEFDRAHGTDTSGRLDVPVQDGVPVKEMCWGYSAVNPDFFDELLRSISIPLRDYSFVDIGCGKGAAVMLASELPFRRLVGVELTRELIEIAERNRVRHVAATGRAWKADWVHADFFSWQIPVEPQLFFLNNPFPEALSLRALEYLETSLRAAPRPALLVFRKAPENVGQYLHASQVWEPIRLTPFWRVYRYVGDLD